MRLCAKISTIVLGCVLLFTKVQGLEFIIEPTNTVVQSGSTAVLDCAARSTSQTSGGGHVDIRWRGPDGQDISFIGETYRSQLGNGSLYFNKVIENQALTGTYQCLAILEPIGTIVSRPATLKIAVLPDIDTHPVDQTVILGQTAYFPCLVTPIDRSLHYTVSWLKDERSFKLDDLRMSLLPSGALEIDEVTNSDKGVYRCNVSDSNQYRLSNKANLDIQEDNMPTPPSFIALPLSQTVIEGETVTLDCAANGNPRPEITWLKGGYAIDLNDLDTRHRIVGVGSLQVMKVEEIDSGVYQCRAENKEESLDATANLNVQVPPKFIKMPADKMDVEKEDLELECAIEGNPQPKVQWLKNGEVIKPNDYMQIVNGNNLRILGLVLTDAGLFQCVGTNPAGSIQASARLTILGPDSLIPIIPGNFKPKNRPSKNRQAQTRLDFISPSILGTSNDSRPFKETTRNVLNSLKSEDFNLDKSFAGDYDDDNSHIDVTDLKNQNNFKNHRNHAIAQPHSFLKDTKKYLTSLVSSDDDDFSSNSELNPLESHPGSNLGQTLSAFTPLPTFTTESSPESNIDGSISGETLHSLDNQEDMNGLPGPPADLAAYIVKPRFVTLKWSEPEPKNGEILAYSVYYKLQGSQRERVSTTKSKVEEIVIAHLQPSKVYLFRVVANNSLGAGESSEILEVITQAEEHIAGPPTNVKAEALTSTKIAVSWQPPLITNGDIIKYKVYYMEGDSSDESHQDTTDHYMELMNLPPFTVYNIFVVAVNENGPGTASSEMQVRTYSNIPSEPPHNVTLEPTSTSITVHWQPPPVSEHNGIITGYKIKYRKYKVKKTETSATAANLRFVVIRNLDRDSEYQIKICALNVNGSGPYTDWHNVHTYENDLDESVVPGAPTPLKVKPSSDSITVSWNPPLDQFTKIRGYTLGWGKGYPDVYNQLLSDTVRYYVIKDLEPNCEYVISLRARNEVGDGPPVYSNIRTREEVAIEHSIPLVPPVGLKAIVLSSTAVVVYWTDTTLSKSQFVTDKRHYVVRYTTTGSPRYRYYNSTDLNCMIGELRPNTQYEFTVKVVKGKRESPWSMEVVNTTQQALPNSAPRDLTVIPPTPKNNYVTLQWQPPKLPNGPITGYVIFYSTDKSLKERDWEVEGVVGDKHSITLRSLNPGTTYYFRVQARNVKGVGPSSQYVTYTTESGVNFGDSGYKDGRGGAFSGSLVLYLAIGGSIVLITILAVVVVICCRRNSDPNLERNKKSYQKNSAANIKPPDLWIHHDQMELKAMEKAHSTNSACNDGASSSGAMTLPRSVGHDFDPISDTALSHPHPSNSLDKRTYVPGYIAVATTPVNNGNITDTSGRPAYPRTQYSISRAHVTLDQHNMPMTQNISHNAILNTNGPHGSLNQNIVPHAIVPSMSVAPAQIPLSSAVSGHPNLSHAASLAGSLAQTPENPYGYDTVTSAYSNQPPIVSGSPYAPVDSKRGQGHPLKSFSVPAPPNNSTPNTPNAKHNMSQVTIRPQNSSPYKKASVSGNRLQAGPTVSHSSEEVQRLAPSHSTEELHQEMANLEGLMKDLNAITASEFEC